MKNYFAAVRNEQKKFLNWKIIIGISIFVIIFACLIYPVYDLYYDANDIEIRKATDKEINELEYDLKMLKYNYNEFNYPIEYKNISECSMSFLKYQIDNGIYINKNSLSINSICGFLQVSNRWAILLIVMAIIFGSSLMTKEYNTKNMLQLKTFAIKKDTILLAKITILLEFVTIINILYFTIIACFITKFGGTNLIFIATSNGKIGIYNRYYYLFIMAVMVCFCSFVIGVSALMLSTCIHNSMIVFPIITIPCLAIHFSLMAYNFSWIKFLPFISIYYAKNIITNGSACGYEWWILFVNQLIYLIVSFIIASFNYRKQQVKL